MRWKLLYMVFAFTLDTALCLFHRDGDSVRDEDDNCVNLPNAEQADKDGDKSGWYKLYHTEINACACHKVLCTQSHEYLISVVHYSDLSTPKKQTNCRKHRWQDRHYPDIIYNCDTLKGSGSIFFSEKFKFKQVISVKCSKGTRACLFRYRSARVLRSEGAVVFWRPSVTMCPILRLYFLTTEWRIVVHRCLHVLYYECGTYTAFWKVVPYYFVNTLMK